MINEGMMCVTDTPFWDKETNESHFPYDAVGDRVFLWRKSPKEKIGSIYVPDVAQVKENIAIGVILSAGQGYYDNKVRRFKKNNLKTGDCVLFNPSIPWKMDIKGLDDVYYEVWYMGEQDIFAVLTEE